MKGSVTRERTYNPYTLSSDVLVFMGTSWCPSQNSTEAIKPLPMYFSASSMENRSGQVLSIYTNAIGLIELILHKNQKKWSNRPTFPQGKNGQETARDHPLCVVSGFT